MTDDSSTVASAPVGRLAPSPTGELHIGHARSFLLAWWSIRSRSGRLLLRIEDLDRDRVKPGAVDGVLRDLEWLGLDWDGPVQLQSEGQEHLNRVAEQLVEQNLAFPCFCTRREIELSAPHTSDGETRYPGTCRDRFATEALGEAELSRKAGLRFRCDPKELRLDDAFTGAFSCNPGNEVGDFAIRRRDGAIAYQLAVVVDDERSGVTEVLRGRDLLSSTGRQWLLQEALGYSHPTWIHVPLVVDDVDKRLAKRDGDFTLASLRTKGIDPRGLVTWIARGAGLEVPELATAGELVSEFELERVPKADVRFGADAALGLIMRE